MSQGIIAEKEKPRHRFRVSALLPFVLAGAAFGLTIPIFLEGRTPGNLNDAYLLSLNTSKAGQDLITFTSTINDTAPFNFTPADILAPLGILYNVVMQKITDAVNDQLLAINQELHNINDELGRIEGLVMSGFADQIGLADFYDFHVLRVCEGNYTGSNNPVSTKKYITCTSYADKVASLNAITSKIPSSITLGLTQVSTPIVSKLADSFRALNSLVAGLTNVMLAFFVISLIGSGITALASLAAVFLADSPLITHINLVFSTLGLTFQVCGASSVSAIAGTISSVIEYIGGTMNIFVDKGSEIFALTWAAVALIWLANGYWLAVWFVEFRRYALQIRKRAPDEIGNWKSIGKQVRSNLKPSSTM